MNRVRRYRRSHDLCNCSWLCDFSTKLVNVPWMYYKTMSRLHHTGTTLCRVRDKWIFLEHWLPVTRLPLSTRRPVLFCELTISAVPVMFCSFESTIFSIVSYRHGPLRCYSNILCLAMSDWVTSNFSKIIFYIISVKVWNMILQNITE